MYSYRHPSIYSFIHPSIHLPIYLLMNLFVYLLVAYQNPIPCQANNIEVKNDYTPASLVNILL